MYVKITNALPLMILITVCTFLCLLHHCMFLLHHCMFLSHFCLFVATHCRKSTEASFSPGPDGFGLQALGLCHWSAQGIVEKTVFFHSSMSALLFDSFPQKIASTIFQDVSTPFVEIFQHVTMWFRQTYFSKARLFGKPVGSSLLWLLKLRMHLSQQEGPIAKSSIYFFKNMLACVSVEMPQSFRINLTINQARLSIRHEIMVLLL